MFRIKANPTFPVTVKIRAPGGEVQELKVVFRHKRRDDVKKFFEEASEKSRSDVECLLELIESWEADAKLSADSVGELLQNYPSSAHAIFASYMEELIDARLGN
jgi:hypothetical protein